MSDRKLFEGFPSETRLFYAKIVYMMMLNKVAYDRCLFDTLLCDTDDVFTFIRFVEQMDDIREQLIGKTSLPDIPDGY